MVWLDVALEPFDLDPPLPTPADLHRRDLATAHQGIDLSRGDAEHVGGVGQRHEALLRAVGHVAESVTLGTTSDGSRVTACGERFTTTRPCGKNVGRVALAPRCHPARPRARPSTVRATSPAPHRRPNGCSGAAGVTRGCGSASCSCSSRCSSGRRCSPRRRHRRGLGCATTTSARALPSTSDDVHAAGSTSTTAPRPARYLWPPTHPHLVRIAARDVAAGELLAHVGRRRTSGARRTGCRWRWQPAGLPGRSRRRRPRRRVGGAGRRRRRHRTQSLARRCSTTSR